MGMLKASAGVTGDGITLDKRNAFCAEEPAGKTVKARGASVSREMPESILSKASAAMK